MIDINGRNPFAKYTYREVGKKLDHTFGMGLGGRVRELHDFQFLDKNKGYPEETELLPQRTVVQFNSTYMELTGRTDRIKGDVTYSASFFLFGFLFCLKYFLLIILSSISKEQIVVTLSMGLICALFLVVIVFLILLMVSEIFSFTYFPIRFNRKTRKVYVRQANRKVDIFDWDKLNFYMATTYKDGGDIRGFTYAEDGITIERMFSLPFVSDLTVDEELLTQHFEFIRRYMDAETDEELIEVNNAIRYTHPVHKKRETPFVSFERVFISIHDSFRNLEYPKQAFNPDWHHVVALIVLWPRYIGRLISINTSITPRFSKEIEAECTIEANDPFDLDKYPPEGKREDIYTWRYKLGFVVVLTLSTLFMLIFSSWYIDTLGVVKGGDYPSLLDGLINILTLRWLF